MAVYKLDHLQIGNFLQTHKPVVLDETLSNTAKIVLQIALCYKSDKNVTPDMLAKHMASGETAIRSAIRVLKARGYVHIHQGRFNGQFTNTTYDYYESPALNPHFASVMSNQPVTPPPYMADPDLDLPHVDYPHAVNRHDNKIKTNNDIDSNHTRNNNNSLSNHINQSINHHITSGEIEEMERAIKQQIDYDVLRTYLPYRYVDDIVQTMLSVMVQGSEYISVSKDVSYPTAYIRYMLSKINPQHIEMIIGRLEQDQPIVKNMRGYLLTCLINAVTNLESSYQYGDY